MLRLAISAKAASILPSSLPIDLSLFQRADDTPLRRGILAAQMLAQGSKLVRLRVSVCLPVHPRMCCKTFFGPQTKNNFCHQDRTGILIHRTDHSDSIIAEFPRSGGLTGSFATQSLRDRTICPLRLKQRNVCEADPARLHAVHTIGMIAAQADHAGRPGRRTCVRPADWQRRYCLVGNKGHRAALQNKNGLSAVMGHPQPRAFAIEHGSPKA
jgi:hypothetical protein